METLETRTIPFFPLPTVLFPHGPLPLRVFEPRYLDMVSRCMKGDTEFGVLLIQSGSDTGDARMVSIGTTARIQDWYQGSDGILGITAVGVRRFSTTSVHKAADGLYMGEVDFIESEPRQLLPEEYHQMASLLEVVINDLGKLYENLEKHYDDATWVGRRYAEILPISQAQKQHCLEMNDPLERLAFVRPLLRSIRQETRQ
ncbi:MAG: LON peptidase substrate-binding domain-containing protein [Gammaproteobacteria bacterium]|jgi:Lon protease-like protein|nr:LON peptidase substrate-binding domain-containing protein [Gammaproteobacteria bacterium]